MTNRLARRVLGAGFAVALGVASAGCWTNPQEDPATAVEFPDLDVVGEAEPTDSSDAGSPTSEAPAEAPAQESPAPDDPPDEAVAHADQQAYDAFVAMAETIDDAPDLSLEDAVARAALGCSMQWPDGSVDAALQLAFAPQVAQWQAQGLCNP